MIRTCALVLALLSVAPLSAQKLQVAADATSAGASCSPCAVTLDYVLQSSWSGRTSTLIRWRRDESCAPSAIWAMGGILFWGVSAIDPIPVPLPEVCGNLLIDPIVVTTVPSTSSDTTSVQLPYGPAHIGRGISVQVLSLYADVAATNRWILSDRLRLDVVPEQPGITIDTAWRNWSFAPTSETVIATVAAIPNDSQVEGVIALSDVPISTVADAAVNLRFNGNGVIDALDGDAYRAVNPLPYVAGKTYEFRIVVNVPDLTFDAYVTPLHEAPVQIANGYAFNRDSGPNAQIGYLGLQSATGSFRALEFSPEFHTDYQKVMVKTAYAWSPNGTVRNLTPTPNEGWYGAACIHPQGTDVIFPGAAWGYSRIWKYTVATKKVVPLTAESDVSTLPSYSPDGNSIVFGSDKALDNPRYDMFEVGRTLPDDYGFDGGLTAGSNLFVMDADGQNVRQITFGTDVDRRPSFSPDGRTVVFQSSRGANTLYMWTVPADGSAAPAKVQLNPSPWVGRPRYSVDGSEIYFFTGVTNGQYDPYGRHTLCRVPVGGGAWTTLPNDTLGIGSHGPEADPDGQHLWYHAYVNDLWGVYKLPLSGIGNPVRFRPPGFDFLHIAHATVAANGFVSFDSRSYIQFP